jgi:serine/threonine protein kinase
MLKEIRLLFAIYYLTVFVRFQFRNADDWYAQKELYPLATPDISWKAFVREAYIWARVCKAMKQFNIHQAVTLLCTYEMEVNGRSRFYFISPWATGNLMGLWRTNPSGGDLIKFTDRWMIKQCKDMTEFLSCLHANAAEDSEKFSVPPDQEEPIFMRHGDIKPENILWYADYPGCLDGGALVLGDFGISKAHRRSTKSFSNPVNTKHTETYAAPEFAVKGRQHTIGRASDLWSSACTWLNFATWFVWGIQGVRDFAEERDEQDPNEATFSDDRFFRLTNNNVKAEVKPKVLNWVKRIRKEKKCTPLVEAFIGIAMDDMLVVDGKKRATALEISRKLEYLLK